MKKLFSICVLLFGCLLAQGQEQAEFTADRPGASTGPSVVGHHVVQLEQGIQYDGDGGAGTITFSNTLLRYALDSVLQRILDALWKATTISTSSVMLIAWTSV